MQDLFQQLQHSGWLPYVIAGVVLFVLIDGMILWSILRRRRRPATEVAEDVAIDVPGMVEQGPPQGGPQLTCYGVPVRVAVIVLAPTGRHGELPSGMEMPTLAEGIVPGLMTILSRDRPQVERWPPQLSRHGFIQSFFSNVRLPGDKGKGTPWCSVVGRVDHEGNSYLVGFVLCASKNNALGPVEIEHAGRWLDVLRLRE